MIVRDIVASSASRSVFLRPANYVSDLYVPPLIRRLNERFEFFETPNGMADIDLEKGIKFRHGIYEDHVVDIELVTGGIRVKSKAGTDLCDRVIDEVIAMLGADKNVRLDLSEKFRHYESIIEFESSVNFSGLFSPLEDVGRIVGSFIKSYGGPDDTYRGVGLMMLGQMDSRSPPMFKIERRAGFPIDSDVYFSSAPLSTNDHIAILERVEGAVV